jgi:biopolymer transport protein TolR
MAEINVTPLVDVMLVLLIIFMVTAPMMQEGVSVELPKAGGEPLPTNQIADDIVIAVSEDGSIYVNDKPVEEARLAEMVLQTTKGSPSADVFLRGDTNVAYGRVLAIHSALIKAGIKTVLMITRPGEGAGPSGFKPPAPESPPAPGPGPRAAPVR